MSKQKSAEVHFAQQLAANQPNIREKALKKVGKWLEKVSVDGFDEERLLNIWKGLYYYFWHCDKMLVQEDRADVISHFIHVFKTIECSFLYIDTFFTTITREWHGIDRYRLEKYMMLIRKFLHQSLQLLKNHQWKVKHIKAFAESLKKTVLNPSLDSAPFGLKIHISDIYMEELTKVGSDEVTPKLLKQFLRPYCEILCYSDDPTFLSSVKKDVFLYLINQDADEDTFKEFPVLQFNPDDIQHLLMKYANTPDIRRKNMKVIHSIIKDFEDYKNGINPFGKALERQHTNIKIRKRMIERASMKLLEDEIHYKEEKKKSKKKKFEDVIDS